MNSVWRIILTFFIASAVWSIAGADVPDNSTGSLQISSVPAGADIYLDLVYQGQTPGPGASVNITNLTISEHTLVLKKTGYLDYITTVRPASGETVIVSANLQPYEAPSMGIPLVTIGIIVLVLVVAAGYVIVRIRKRKKQEEPVKVELD